MHHIELLPGNQLPLFGLLPSVFGLGLAGLGVGFRLLGLIEGFLGLLALSHGLLASLFLLLQALLQVVQCLFPVFLRQCGPVTLLVGLGRLAPCYSLLACRLSQVRLRLVAS